MFNVSYRQWWLMIGLFVLLIVSVGAESEPLPEKARMKLKIVIAEQVIIAQLYDTPLSRQLWAQLPLTLDFSDYASTEKIAYLTNKLTTQGTPSAAEITGDVSYYAPWGNLAIFYHGQGHDRNLYTLGKIVSGKAILANLSDKFTATLSRAE